MSLPIVSTNLSIPSIAAPLLIPTVQSAFADALQKVDGYQQTAEASVNRFLSGEGEELHHVAITAQQAEVSFQLFMQVRNKVVAAYQQVMQMQV
jgi:flagellar hook-basal body complex protein FliE